MLRETYSQERGKGQVRTETGFKDTLHVVQYHKCDLHVSTQ